MAVFSEVSHFLGFKHKPRDGAAAGIPLTSTDSLVAFYRGKVLPATIPTITADCTVYDPATDKTFSIPNVIPPYLIATNDYTAEPTGGRSSGAAFADGQILLSVSARSSVGTLPPTGRLHVQILLARGSTSIGQLISDFLYGGHAPTWIAGQPTQSIGPMYSPDVPGTRYTFYGTAYNGAGGAGACSLQVTPAAGGRFRVRDGHYNIDDTAVRVGSITVLDAAAGNVVASVKAAVSDAQALNLPIYNLLNDTSHAQKGDGIMVAGSNVWNESVAAVALSKGVAFGLILEVWGGAPTFLLAGTNTPVLTYTTSRFEGG